MQEVSNKAKVLKVLSEANEGISPNDLATATGLSRMQIFNAVSGIREDLSLKGLTAVVTDGVYKITEMTVARAPKERKKSTKTIEMDAIYKLIEAHPGIQMPELCKELKMTKYQIGARIKKFGKKIIRPGTGSRDGYVLNSGLFGKNKENLKALSEPPAPPKSVVAKIKSTETDALVVMFPNLAMEDIKNIPAEDRADFFDVMKKAALYQSILKCFIQVNEKIEHLKRNIDEN